MKNILHLLTISAMSNPIGSIVHQAINKIISNANDDKEIAFDVTYNNGKTYTADAWKDWGIQVTNQLSGTFLDYSKGNFSNANDFINSKYYFKINNWKVLSNIGWPKKFWTETNTIFSSYNKVSILNNYLNKNVTLTDANDFASYGNTQAKISMKLTDDSKDHKLVATYTSSLYNLNNFENIHNQLFV